MIPASAYLPSYLVIIGALCAILGFRRILSTGSGMCDDDYAPWATLLLCGVLAVWLGLRPISGEHFADTVNYAIDYRALSGADADWSRSGEWLWIRLMLLFKSLGAPRRHSSCLWK